MNGPNMNGPPNTPSSRARRILERLRNRTVAFLHDLLMIPIAWMAAFWLRFNLDTIPSPYFERALSCIPLIMLLHGALFWYQGLYRGVWRFASLPDLLRIVKASVLGVFLIAFALFALYRMADIPRSVLPLYSVLLIVALGSPRLAYRWLKDRRLYMGTSQRALIVGAGAAGEALVRDLLRDPTKGIEPVAFVDDDWSKKGREIQGIRVLGDTAKIHRLKERLSLDVVLLAVPSASSDQYRRIVNLCESADLAMLTVPRSVFRDRGASLANRLRDISIEDLLGRESVQLPWPDISRMVAGQTVLVTGAGGSIGSELSRQLFGLGPARLILFERSEFNLFEIDRELSARVEPGGDSTTLMPILGDVCDRAAVTALFQREQPALVFHAAAFKHVPLLESQLREAVRNNVLGTQTVAQCAVENGCQSFVLISTDKAVNPTNYMGASKRIAEIFCQNLAANTPRTRFITCRFGNVLDSAGSVVPLFREQIANGGPVTVTHPEMRRYFMTIPEACELILQAGTVGQGGEIYVLDMGEPVIIEDLARQMIRLAGNRPDEDIAIRYIGLRPGEKLFEELFHPNEALRPSGHPKLLLARYRPVDWPLFQARLTELRSACDDFDEVFIAQIVEGLVPELVTRPGRASLVEAKPAEAKPGGTADDNAYTDTAKIETVVSLEKYK